MKEKRKKNFGATSKINCIILLNCKLATEQNVKAFHIFTNRTLEELIQKQPFNVIDLKNIQGIGEMKINAFGKELVEIIKKHQQR